MATITVSTDTNYSTLSVAYGDILKIINGATLTINQTTTSIDKTTCNTFGKLLIENNSTTEPIFFKLGTTNRRPTMSHTAAAVLEIRGDWIELGTSNGTASQSFDLPVDANGEPYDTVAQIQVIPPGETEPILFARTPDFADHFGDEKLGTVFLHDETLNEIVFGDGTNGYIPPAGSIIRIANIQLKDTNTYPSNADDERPRFGFATSGTAYFEKCLLGPNWMPALNSASQVTLIDVGFVESTQVMLTSVAGDVLLKNVSFSGKDLVPSLRATRTSKAPILENLFFMDEGTARISMIDHTNTVGGTLRNIRVVQRFALSQSSRAGYYTNVPDVTLENYWYAGTHTGIYCSAGTSNLKAKNLNFNGVGTRNPSQLSSNHIFVVTAANNTFLDMKHWPETLSEGLRGPNKNFINCSYATANNVFFNANFHAGNGDTNSIIYDDGFDNKYINFDVEGEIASDSISFGATTNSAKIYNVFLTDPMTLTNNNDVQWGDATRMQYGVTPDLIDTAPDASGSDPTSLIVYNTPGDRTKASIYRPMGPDISINNYTEVNVTGVALFDNGGRFYLENAGDVVEFETDVHYGVLQLTSYGFFDNGTGFTDSDVEFAVRNPGSTYSPYQQLTNANLLNALSSLPGYDSNNGLQIKYRVTKTLTELASFIYHIRVDADVDPNYRFPFELDPTSLTFSGFSAGDALLIVDENDNIYQYHAFTSSQDRVYNLPPISYGKTYRYIVKRPGYRSTIGSINIIETEDYTVTPNFVQKLQTDGSPMYQGSSSPLVIMGADSSTPGAELVIADIGNGSVTAQEVFDSIEDFLVQEEALEVLIKRGGPEVQYISLDSGEFLLLEEGYRLQNSTAAPNAQVGAYVVSPDIVVNGSNPISFISSPSAGVATVDNNAVAQAVWEYVISSIPSEGQAGYELNNLDDKLETINEGVKKASLLIPHDEDL